MSWNGPRSAHVSQLRHFDGSFGSGWNDCWEGSLERWLREKGILSLSGNIADQLDQVAEVVRGYEDQPGNAITTYGQAEASLQHYGIPVIYTESFDEAMKHGWFIALVAAVELRPAQYPYDWLGVDAPDHFILSLPQWNGAANWFNDPLNPSDADNQYEIASVRGAFSCAYILPDTGNGESGPTIYLTTQKCALKATPSHKSVALQTLAKGARVTDLSVPTSKTDDTWRRVRSGSGKSGWVPTSALRVG